jgi:cytochrome P450
VNVLTVTTFDDAKEIYRHKDFKQALYDAGEVVMGGVLVNLHGDEHRARRRLENRLFRRETLVHYERDLFPQVIQETLAPYVASGRAELVELSHQLMMNLAALNAGVDRPLKTKEETDSLYGFMMKFIEGATLAHTTRDPKEVTNEVEGAKSEFNVQFLAPSIKRRQQLIAAAATDETVELPKDILTELLKNEDSLHLPDEIILKEIAFFLLAGAHTSATAVVRTLDNLFNWLDKHPEDRALVKTDRSFVQRAMFETIRLNPSSPTAMRRATTDITLKSGTVVPKDSLVTIDLMSVNRSANIFGDTASEFNPHRVIETPNVAPWGLSFGHGMHACIGQELAAGLSERSEETSEFEYGLATVAVQAMFDRNVVPNPELPAKMDTTTKRPYWGSYHVIFAS